VLGACVPEAARRSARRPEEVDVKRFYLLLLPLFALPDLLFAQETIVGVLKWTDYVIGPYLLAVLYAGLGRGGPPITLTKGLSSATWWFVAWATLATVTIPLRYNYTSDIFVQVGIVKIGKFALYAVAGIATIRAVLLDPTVLGKLRWSILATLLISALSVYVTETKLNDLPNTPGEAGFRFEALNAVSVEISTLLAYVLGEWAVRKGAVSWRSVGIVVLPVAVLGFFLTGGRGGWVGLLLALAYVLFQVGLKPSFVISGLVLAMVGTFAYTQNESFSHHVDITVNPALLDQETEFAQATGFDDGNRFNIFLKESVKVIRSPILGSGMFHRGFRSGLDPKGSHNFFLQMFLETGLVGGSLIIMLFYRMWKLASSKAEIALGTRAALFAGIVGGCTGEYFYGGPVLLTLLVLMAPACLSRAHLLEEVRRSREPLESPALLPAE
jgi:O-antigen ligase